MVVNVLLDYFTAELEAIQHPAYAEKMADYMKNKFPFYGVQAPARKDIVRRIWATEKSNISTNIKPLVLALWNKDHREYQMIAIDLLGRCKAKLTIADLSFVESLITSKSWWDTVDFLASTNIGYLLSKDKANAAVKAQEYIESDNLWLRRTALIFQLKYKEAVDEQLLFRLIDQTEGSKEFFINKASGWALRQYSKYNPTSVAAYIQQNRSKLSNLTIREGSKYL